MKYHLGAILILLGATSGCAHQKCKPKAPHYGFMNAAQIEAARAAAAGACR